MEQDILLYGEQAVQQPIDAVLENPAAGSPFKRQAKDKKKPKQKRKGRTIVIVGGGFHLYDDDSAELQAIKDTKWSPTTADFAATARATGKKPVPITTAQELVDTLRSSPGSIGRVIIIAHGSPGYIGFGGFFDNLGNLAFPEGQLLSEDVLANLTESIKEIRPKFTENATIDLIACSAATGSSLMQSLADAFDVCVRGRKGKAFYRYPADKDATKIQDRGQLSSDNVNFSKGIKDFKFETEATKCP